MANVYCNTGSAVKDIGGLWEQLDAHLISQPDTPVQEGMGLWGMIVAENVGGVWDEFDNETVLLRHDSSQQGQRDVWEAAADETLILPREGLLSLWDAALAKTDATGGIDLDGTLMLMRDDVENVWERSANETLLMARPTENVFAQQIRSRDLTTYHPMHKPGYAFKKLTDARGEMYWILKNLRTDAYLRLTAEQVFLWDQMDGEASVQDIAIAYMMAYGKLAIASLLLLLDQLQQKGFIEPLVDIYGAVDQSVAQRRANVLWRRLVSGFFNTEFSIGGIDALITRSYRGIGKFFFMPVLQWVMLAVIVAGGVTFIGLMLNMFSRDVAIIGGAGVLLGIITLYVLQFITLMIHEWAHAIATKHYGRGVRRGGFLLYMGMPAAFVDTTDIWMEPRRPRIVVSWAGPHSGFFLGGLASLLVLVAPGALVQGLLYQFAFLTYMTSFMNLNPLLKLDGYYILMDWLEIPRLREKSLAFIGYPLREKLRQRERFNREERIFTIFGMLSGLWTLLTLLFVVFSLGNYLLAFAQTILGMIVIGLLGLAILLRWGWPLVRRNVYHRA